MSPVPITGPTLPQLVVGRDPPSRLEINTFVNKEDHFSLYVQALQAIYSQSQDDLLSYFQIAGIHGLPYIEWNQSPGGESGYCSHGTNIFPTWHRPYVALIEQAIQARAVQIAATYKVDTARWNQAAADLRQPYWDWALNSVPPTQIISDQKVNIITPDGRRTLVDNPFVRYRFHPDGSSPTPAPTPFLRYNTTLRHPKNTASGVVEDIDELTSALSASQSSISEDTYNLFSVTSWPEFSNHSTTGGFTNS
jgi:tyrosinase